MKTPTFWQSRSLISYLLLPASLLYWFATHTRRLFTKTRKADVPVICVGNAVAGGAGKTPVAIALAALLADSGKKIFFLSRGYGGKLAEPTLVDSTKHTAKDVGDEPLLLAAHAPTIVAKDRRAGAALAKQSGAEVIIMDDGFQNPSLHKDFSLLVVDSQYGAGNGFLLPAGPLREPMDLALARADAVIVMHPPGDARFIPVHPLRIDAWLTALNAEMFAGKRVLAFAAIARPEKFFATLRAIGADVVQECSFPDHHAYSDDELNTLNQQAQTQQAVAVTTEKDMVKIAPEYHSKIHRLKVRAVFDDAADLRSALEKTVGT